MDNDFFTGDLKEDINIFSNHFVVGYIIVVNDEDRYRIDNIGLINGIVSLFTFADNTTHTFNIYDVYNYMKDYDDNFDPQMIACQHPKGRPLFDMNRGINVFTCPECDFKEDVI